MLTTTMNEYLFLISESVELLEYYFADPFVFNFGKIGRLEDPNWLEELFNIEVELSMNATELVMSWYHWEQQPTFTHLNILDLLSIAVYRCFHFHQVSFKYSNSTLDPSCEDLGPIFGEADSICSLQSLVVG